MIAAGNPAGGRRRLGWALAVVAVGALLLLGGKLWLDWGVLVLLESSLPFCS